MSAPKGAVNTKFKDTRGRVVWASKTGVPFVIVDGKRTKPILFKDPTHAVLQWTSQSSVSALSAWAVNKQISTDAKRFLINVLSPLFLKMRSLIGLQSIDQILFNIFKTKVEKVENLNHALYGKLKLTTEASRDMPAAQKNALAKAMAAVMVECISAGADVARAWGDKKTITLDMLYMGMHDDVHIRKIMEMYMNIPKIAAARKIQQAFRDAQANPYNPIGRRRLLREFEEMRENGLAPRLSSPSRRSPSRR